MSETINELGLVDYLVVEFPGSKFNDMTEPESPRAAGRMARRGVIGPAPVARTAAVVGAAAVVSHGVGGRTDRRDGRRGRRR